MKESYQTRQGALILQTIVLAEIIFAVFLDRSADLLVISQFRQPFQEILLERYLAQILVCHFVLHFYPSGGSCAGIIFQPSVRVGNLRTEIHVYSVYFCRLGVDRLFLLGSA